METFLKKTTDYAVDPINQMYALHGSAVHTLNENYTEGNMLSEERLHDEITSGSLIYLVKSLIKKIIHSEIIKSLLHIN